MKKLTLGIAIAVLASALAAPADAAGRGGGGGGGGRGGGGGGGGAHFSGGGGGGAHFSGGGGGRSFSGGGGVSHFSTGARFSSGPRYSGSTFSSGARLSSGPKFHSQRFSGQKFSSGAQFSNKSGMSKHSLRSNSRGNYSVTSGGRSNKFTSNQNKSNKFANRNGRLDSKFSTKNAGLHTDSLRTKTVRDTLKSKSVAGALNNKAALHDPKHRAQIVASAAMAGKWQGKWQGNNWKQGHWWRHRHGGFGWVGPLFWPFAYYDFYDYAWWGDDYYDYAFWDYGYDDIYTGIFSPYDYDDLAGYLPPVVGTGRRVASRGRSSTAAVAQDDTPQSEPSQLTQMCGDDSADIASLPIDRFRQAIQPNEQQQAALDELAAASAKASQDIKAACPTQLGLTAPTRLTLMEQRIEAMITAVRNVRPPLEKLYGLLNDEQKVRLAALGNEQRRRQPTTGSLAQSCTSAQPSTSTNGWPTAEIERVVRLSDAQRVSFADLQNASAKAAEMLKSCPPDNLVTPPARLEAIEQRLETMLEAVKTVHTALDAFYGQLNDEQKARFESLGPLRAGQQADASEDQGRRRVRHRSHRHNVNIYGIMRRFGI